MYRIKALSIPKPKESSYEYLEMRLICERSYFGVIKQNAKRREDLIYRRRGEKLIISVPVSGAAYPFLRSDHSKSTGRP